MGSCPFPTRSFLSLCCFRFKSSSLAPTSLPPSISVSFPTSMRKLRHFLQAPGASGSARIPSPVLSGTQTALQSFIGSLVAPYLFSYSAGKSRGNFPGTTGLRFEAVPSNNAVMDTKLACLCRAYFPCRTTAGVARMAQDSLWGISFLGQRSAEYFFFLS